MINTGTFANDMTSFATKDDVLNTFGSSWISDI